MSRSDTIGLLFICAGNICRSPLAEGVFRHRARERGFMDRFHVDSAGTGAWHAGEPADQRARDVAARHGIVLDGVARQVSRKDFTRFDLLLCADAENLDTLLDRGAPPEKTRLLLSCDPGASLREVPDPYGGGSADFETVFRLVDSASAALLDRLLAPEGGSRRG